MPVAYDHEKNPLVFALREAWREQRDEFQERYYSFWKCSKCGAYICRTAYMDEYDAYDASLALCCGPIIRARYTPPPECP